MNFLFCLDDPYLKLFILFGWGRNFLNVACLTGVLCSRFSVMLFGAKCFPFVEQLIVSEPRREKTGLRDFRPGPTQTGLYKLRSRLEA